MYALTPLVSLGALAGALGVSAVFVKDESRRFGLNSFKALGGSFAMAMALSAMWGLAPEKCLWPNLLEASRERPGEVVFVTATDGNHGRGVAWAAAWLGQKAVVLMPKGSDPERAENIRAEGAECHVTDLDYDDAVREAAEMAKEDGRILLQDTALPGHEFISGMAMLGYATMVEEILGELSKLGAVPAHLFLQAGVGSFAAAILGRFRHVLGERCPAVVIAEPASAGCLFRSMEAGDGNTRAAGGEMDTIMAGLACGEPNPLGWPILRDYAFGAMRCGDQIAADGMRMLAAPLPGDRPIVSGESGAVTCGLLGRLRLHDGCRKMGEGMGLDGSSVVLLISTEGDTSRDMYRRVVWHGLYGENNEKG
jgi:diaminopropionate ammonia-lyase